ncbi:hypothetical protein Sango_0640200 [Sesamum angolense]|uniref:Reverse transcriptase RNase H-like domain-containing protein n=1 Tax=Sesamum angolense TaxID=2727404 RepID=A0AAE2C271_9LAMI|nr:hypothetical protein Sango_0640200 [Sesamum angolense]
MTPTLGIPEEPLSDKDHVESIYEKEMETDSDGFQPSQNTYNEGDRLHTSESCQDSFSRMTVSNKTMERIMRQDSNLSPHDGFRIGGIGKVLNQIGLNQRKHHIIYKVSSGEFAIPMEFTGNLMEMQLIPKEEILEELRKLMIDIHPRIAYNLADQDFSRVLTLHQDFKRNDLMKEGNRPYSITYRIALLLVDMKAWWDRNKIEITLKIKDECKSEYVRYKPIQMNMKDKKNMQMIIKEHINLGLIKLGISAYSSPGFLVKNHGEIKRGIFIKDLAKYRKDFRPLLKETESAKWKWEEIHTQRVCELKQVCNNLPKLAISQDEDELVVYTDANDYRWAVVLMKKTTIGEEPCRYTGGLFTEQQTQVWHINEKEFFAVWKAFKKWPLFLLTKEFTLKVDNLNVKAFMKNKLESKIEKAQMEASEANSIMLRLRHLRENLEEFNQKFGQLAVNAQLVGQIQRADLDIVQIAIRTTMVASTSL